MDAGVGCSGQKSPGWIAEQRMAAPENEALGWDSSETDPVLGPHSHAQRARRGKRKNHQVPRQQGPVVVSAVEEDEARERAEGPEASLSREVARP